MEWDIEIIQDEKSLKIQQNEVNLQKRPFTIKVSAQNPMTVQLNVLDNDSNFKIIRRFHRLKSDTFCRFLMGQN